MSNKFVVEGGLKIGSGKYFELSGYDVDNISNSTTLAGDSSAALVTEYAVKTYVDAQLGASDIDLALDGTTQTSIDQSTGKLGLSSTANEIEIAYAHDGTDGTFTIGLPDDVTIGQDLTVSRNIDISGTLAAGNSTISGTVSSSGTMTGATGSMFGTLTVADGSLTDSSGAISFGDENLSTSGTLAAGNTTISGTVSSSGTMTAATGSQIGNMTLADGSITDSSGAISFGDENLSTTGTLDAANTVINGTLSASGNTELDGTLAVDGAATFNSIATMLSGSQLSSDSASAVTADADIANKAYVDSVVGDADLDVVVDGTDYDLDLDSEKIGFAGTANEIEVAFGEANSVGTLTIGLPDAVTIGDTLSVTGALSAASSLEVDGATSLDGNVTLGDAAADDITFTGSAASNLVPKTGGTYDLGSSTATWNNIYVDTLAGDADEMVISADGEESSLSGETADTLSIHASAGAWFSGDVNVAGDVKGTGTEMVISADDDTTALGGADSLSLNASGGIYTTDVITMSAGYEMEHMKKDEFSVSMDGTDATCFTFDDSTYTSAKVVAKVNDGTNITSKEILIVSNGTDVSIVEYGTVSVGTEISQEWKGSTSQGTCTITCDAASGTMVGSFELIK